MSDVKEKALDQLLGWFHLRMLELDLDVEGARQAAEIERRVRKSIQPPTVEVVEDEEAYVVMINRSLTTAQHFVWEDHQDPDGGTPDGGKAQALQYAEIHAANLRSVLGIDKSATEDNDSQNTPSR